MSSASPPSALLALADIASLYERCGSLNVNSLASASVQPVSSNHDTTAATASDRSTPVSSLPAKKRPVSLTQADTIAAEPCKKAKIAPKRVDSGVVSGTVVDTPGNPTRASTTTTTTTSSDNAKPIKRKTTKPSKQVERKGRKYSLTSSPSFPAILMGMLSSPNNAQCITFLKDDRRFVILDPAQVETKLLPMHFEATSTSLYSNFVTMLDAWGFKCETDEEFPGKKVYGHPMLKKGDWEGCLKITKPGSIDTAIDQLKSSALMKPLTQGTMPPLPSPESHFMPAVKTAQEPVKQMPQPPQLAVPKTPSLALLNASLSKHMSATETSRNLCNRYGLLQDSSKILQAHKANSAPFQASMQAQQNEASSRSTLQAMIQARNSSSLKDTMVQNQQNEAQQNANFSPFQAPMQAQQNQLSALQAIIRAQNASVPQETLHAPNTSPTQALSSLQQIVQAQDTSSLQSMMQAQQARRRLISAAVDITLQDNGKPRTISPEFSQAAAMLVNQTPSSQLDVLTERFIKNSMERMLNRKALRSRMSQEFGTG